MVDNASRDGVPRAIEREYAKDPRVCVMFNDANLGFGPAVNRGVNIA
ncbi:MAG: glycosyltransferase [Rhodanobacteraceae bacterium]